MALSVVIVGSGTCLGAVSNAAGGALSESPELERPFICQGQHARDVAAIGPPPRMFARVAPTGVTIVVPDDYDTIQAAVDAAAPGDTVYVRSGTYFEHVVLNKQLTLQGEDLATTIIDGGGTGDVIEVSVNGPVFTC